MDRSIAARKAREAAEEERAAAQELARRDREYKETHRLPPGVPIPEELAAAREALETLPPGRLRDTMLQLSRGSALEVRVSLCCARGVGFCGHFCHEYFHRGFGEDVLPISPLPGGCPPSLFSHHCDRSLSSSPPLSLACRSTCHR